MTKILGIVGTDAKQSYNRMLLADMQQRYAKQAEIQCQELAGIPLFNRAVATPSVVLNLVQHVTTADGLIIATPEYDHSIPAILKNALEWLAAQNHVMTHKPVMIVGASYGPQGSARAQIHLRDILAAPDIEAEVLAGHEILIGNAAQQFSNDGSLQAGDYRDAIDCALAAFLKLK